MTQETAQPQQPFSAQYQFEEDTISLLDIFYETSSSGLISDLNASVSTGAQVSGFINFDFIQILI